MSETRVCLDATPLLLRSAGVKTYVYYWAKALQEAAPPGALSLFPFLTLPEQCLHERSHLSYPATLARLALLHSANYSPVPILNFGRAFSLFHASHQLLKPPTNIPATATLYDMTCWLVPEMHSAANVNMAKKFAKRVLKRAAGLIAISDSTRQDAIRILGLDPDRVTVIYPGVAEAFFGAKPAVRRKPYVLFVGTIEPRKNVGTLLDAYATLPDDLRQAFDLVVVGSAGWGDPGVLARLRSGLPGVHYLGYQPEEAMPGLTAGASVFVYPSLYEGFGLPVAQAMAAGVPVVTSAVSSLPEVAAGGALCVDPRSASELRQALETLLESPDRRTALAEAGVLQARRYHWDVCARDSWSFFRRIGG